MLLTSLEVVFLSVFIIELTGSGLCQNNPRGKNEKV